MQDIAFIKKNVSEVALSYPIKRIDLFGSYAQGIQSEKSDVDLLVEFTSAAISLLTLSELRLKIEERLGLAVDLIHAPIPKNSLLDLGQTVTLYEK